MRLALALVALLALTGCEQGPVHQAEWTPVPGATWIGWLCDGPNLIYRTTNGNAFAVAPADPRCKETHP
jgi:hypothetical protein